MNETDYGEKIIDLRVKRMSIRRRLPLLISILLLSLVLTFSAIAYLGVRKASMSNATERLRALTDQLGGMFSKSATVVSTQVLTIANDSVLKRQLEKGSEVTSTHVKDLIKSLRKDSLTILSELLDSNLQVIERSSDGNVQIIVPRDSLVKNVMAGLPVDVSKFYNSKDSIYYAVVAAVRSGKKNIGYILQWHLLYATPQTLEQLSQLIGTNALLYFANTDGSIWTNFVGQVKSPPQGAFDKDGILKYERVKGQPVLAAQAPIVGTPWLVQLEFSEQLVVSAANRFLYWMIIAGLILVVIAIVITTIMSRNITRPLKDLTGAVANFNVNNDPLTVLVRRNDEIGKLAQAYNAMSKQVTAAHRDLEVKVIELEDKTAQLRELSAYIEKIREEERISIAREMHDELGQLLTAFKMDAVILKKRLGENITPLIAENISDMTKGVDEAIKFVRRLASDLRPRILDDLGLVAALEWFSEDFTKRYNIDVRFSSGEENYELNPEQATALFRIYQESLTNVARHSEATMVEGTLNVHADKLRLSISDNGKGFEVQNSGKKKSLGLLGMKERAAIIGGNLEIVSSAGKGTEVYIEIQLQQPAFIVTPAVLSRTEK
jgi:signal transduction histidine kinase